MTRITRIEWAPLDALRPRHAGSNARLGSHGINVRLPIARITLDDGASGLGFCRIPRSQAEAALGCSFDEAFLPNRRPAENWLPMEYPLWDLAAKRAGVPVYALAASLAGKEISGGLQVPCYDTSLYFDDLHLDSQDEAAALLAREAREGYDRGHRAFKIKVGRGARHLPPDQGIHRDIAIVRAVRQAVGPDSAILLDANNGYNLNLAKWVLDETADCKVFWLEEAFHEDPVLYRCLREWLLERGLAVLIADGEGDASPWLLDWARDGLIDVVQYDIFHPGFTRWLALGPQLDSWGVRSAPHHYGGLYGNYAACHLAAVIDQFTYVEWDEAAAPAVHAPGYKIQNGRVSVPATPGFGLELEEELFRQAVNENGFEIR